MIKIIILDDHELFGHGVAKIIEAEDDLSVLKVFTDPNLLTHYIKTLQPNIVLCDIKIKDVNGLNIVKTYSKKYPKIKFIMLSGYNLEEYKIKAYENGAVGFILKDESTDKLVDGIRAVYYFNQNLKHDMVLAKPLLSDQEKEILRMIAKDMKNQEISEALFISKRTVEYHITKLIRKLGVESRLGAVIKGIKLGIIEESETKI
ncbi:response regulator transcription factor [Macrococcus epidermidis]|uniref:response regulator transcription factor n=1 Tax=Macrococcus epidermidis TaxID=1902580 RepID=UPI001EF3459F|nr:response regulator transcription factor [Macrococcus epidermidis]MCG7420643.1 response regulator transcription factor [Macrococcus epidermidis]